MTQNNKDKKKHFQLPSALQQLQHHIQNESNRLAMQPSSSYMNSTNNKIPSLRSQKRKADIRLFSSLTSNLQLWFLRYQFKHSKKEVNRKNWNLSNLSSMRLFLCWIIIAKLKRNRLSRNILC